MAGFISMMQAEHFFSKLFNRRKAEVMVAVVFFLCGYGIYIGRFLRFNSWDLFTEPAELLTTTARHFLMPVEHIAVWKFTFLFSLLLLIFYLSLKQFSSEGAGRLNKT